MKPSVVITGATGFIGKSLCAELQRDYAVVAVTRNVDRAASLLGDSVGIVGWDGKKPDDRQSCIEGAFGLVNLAGENIAGGRWTKGKKERIFQSRVDSTKVVVEGILRADRKPDVFIQASAVGYYGTSGSKTFDEGSGCGAGFLAEVCNNVETIARQVEKEGVRVVLIRTGVVLGLSGGALPMFIKPFRFHFGGYIGSGSRRLPWISLRDEVKAIRFLLENEKISGPFNLVSASPATVGEFSATLGKALGRASWTRMPGFIVRVIFGDMADEVLLCDQHVEPRRLMEAGFQFEDENLEKLLRRIAGGRKK